MDSKAKINQVLFEEQKAKLSTLQIIKDLELEAIAKAEKYAQTSLFSVDRDMLFKLNNEVDALILKVSKIHL